MLSVNAVAAIAGTSRHTVEREIRRGNLSAQRVGRHWAINPWEARRWAAQFQPYDALRKGRSEPAQVRVAGTGQPSAGGARRPRRDRRS